MNIPDRVIEAAMEGGWTDGHYDYYAGYEVTVLDPLFWQALSKSLEWVDGTKGKYKYYWHEWLNQSQAFHHLVMTNGDTDKFWADLLQTKPTNQ